MLSPDTAMPGRTTHETWPVVLDTNVVLDWLVFNDASCDRLAEQIHAGRLRWLATDAMRAELRSVLPRPELMAWKPDGEHVLSVFDRWVSLLPAASALPLPMRLTCRDTDDQKFIDLAIAIGACWLFSRDRALLDLAKTARRCGVEILTPADWLRRHATSMPHDDLRGVA